MKKTITVILVMLLTLAMMLAACGNKKEEAPKEEESTTEKTEVVEVDTPDVVKSFDEIDTEDMMDLPLQIESVTLFDDGSVRIVPLDDLKKNAESNDELVDDAMYPFDDSGKAVDIFLVRFGNGGYRTIIALMEDGSLSALSARELIEDRICVVMDNVSGRDGFVSVEEVENEDSFGVIGRTESGDEVELDFSLNF
jgi:hypothetical protein